jgi:kynurenine formamidase
MSLEAARFLVDGAHPIGFGIDTLSIECGSTEHLVVHRLLLGAGLYILENVANLESLPPTGALVIALPLKLLGGSGSPARVVALVPNRIEVR